MDRGHKQTNPGQHHHSTSPPREEVKVASVLISCPDIQKDVLHQRAVIPGGSQHTMMRPRPQTGPALKSHPLRSSEELPHMTVTSQGNASGVQTTDYHVTERHGHLRRGRLKPLILDEDSDPPAQPCQGISPHFK